MNLPVPIACRLLLVACVIGVPAASSCAAGAERLAQVDSGSLGGSIGGSIEPSGPAPSRRLPRAQAPRSAPVRRAARGTGGSYDGAWSVSSGGGCSGAGNSQVTISGSRVIAQSGTGHVSPSGSVSTIASFNGLTITGRGQIVGNSATGTYRQSDGCSGTWSAVRM